MTDFKFSIDDLMNEQTRSFKQAPVFGLNQGCTLDTFKLVEPQNDNENHYLEIVVLCGGNKLFSRLYFNEALYYKDGLVTPDMDNYVNVFRDVYSQHMSVIKGYLLALGVTKQQIASIEYKDANSTQQLVPLFIEAVKDLLILLPKNYKSIPVDVFLEYQWTIQKDKDKTYLTLPKNTKGGTFICKSIPAVGAWVEQFNKQGLSYIDEAGNYHPFLRDNWFMESNKAIQQNKTVEDSTPVVNDDDDDDGIWNGKQQGNSPF